MGSSWFGLLYVDVHLSIPEVGWVSFPPPLVHKLEIDGVHAESRRLSSVITKDISFRSSDERLPGMREGDEDLALERSGSHHGQIQLIARPIGGIENDPRSIHSKCSHCFRPPTIGADHDAETSKIRIKDRKRISWRVFLVMTLTMHLVIHSGELTAPVVDQR